MILADRGIVDYLSTSEAAELWGVSERSVRNYCALGRVPGAIRAGRSWLVPADMQKPPRENGREPQESALLKRLREERDAHVKGGIYHKLQVEFTYSSNHMEGSRLTLDQTRLIFDTATVRADGEVLRIDDVFEAANHFRCIDYCLEVAREPLSESVIKEFHRLLKQSTSDAALDWFAVGEYKRVPNEVGGHGTTAPQDVSQAMKSLLRRYDPRARHELRDLLAFHVDFERIHPFQDGNGRVGRLVLLKESLREGMVPPIITADMHWYYNRGIVQWGHEDGYLTDTILAAQDRVVSWLDYFGIPYQR